MASSSHAGATHYEVDKALKDDGYVERQHQRDTRG